MDITLTPEGDDEEKPIMMKKLFAFALAFLVAALARAQTRVDTWTPALPIPTERKIADVASWATLAAAIALDTRRAWRAEDRAGALSIEAGRLMLTVAAVQTTKQLVLRRRPCAPACGLDDPDRSFFSGHTAFAFSTGNPWLGAATGGLRVAAGKHWLTDVLVGAGVGWLTSRIR